MKVFITGVNTQNKGAELMLIAIKEFFDARPGKTLLAVEPSFGGYLDRTRYGLYLMFDSKRFSKTGVSLRLLSNSTKGFIGLMSIEDVDVVLDASGFAFGDQHPLHRTEGFAQQVRRWKAMGKVVIMLPQALGPFEKREYGKAFNEIASYADVVYARDQLSYEYSRGVTGNMQSIKMAPDFTNLVKPDPGVGLAWKDVACIVPNQRMIEKAARKEDAEAYRRLLISLIVKVEQTGLVPVLLAHGADDLDLIRAIRKTMGGPETEVISESDPRRIKGILGRSTVVIASRYHALISALSQGVPCIATSWSHKYQMLFEEYGCEDMILPVQASDDCIDNCLVKATGVHRGKLQETIMHSADRIKAETRNMWEELESHLLNQVD